MALESTSLSRSRSIVKVLKAISLGVYKATFKVGSLVAPGRTAARGAALFSTPTRPHPSKLDLPSGIPIPQISEVTLAAGGVTVYAWGDASSKPTVILVHGWNGWAMQFSAFISPLIEQGFAVIAFDQPGHGRSVAGRSLLPIFIDATRELIENTPTVVAVVAHSLGAAAAAAAVASTDVSLRHLVLIAPPRGPRIFLEKFAAALGMATKLVDAMQSRLERDYGRSFDEVDVRRFGPDVHARTLVVHDRTDGIVPVEHGEEYASLMDGARLIYTEGMGHARILQATHVVRAVVDFILKPVFLPNSHTVVVFRRPSEA